ncbi:MAG: 50S ribosomal protein L9 [Thermodesulfobacteriota bacterium]
MKVILKESVENLGTVGDVVAVKDGYARNYLVPRGLAMLADPRNVKALEHQKKALEKKRLREVSKAEELAAALAGVRLVFRRKASEQEQLFGSVTHLDVEAALAEKGFAVSRKQVALDHPIKALGEFPVTLRLPGNVKAKVTVVVEKEGEA